MTESTFSYVKRITDIKLVHSSGISWLELEFETQTPGNKYADRHKIVLHGDHALALLVQLLDYATEAEAERPSLEDSP